MPSYSLEELEKFMSTYNYKAFDIITEKPIDLKSSGIKTTDVLFKQIQR